MTDFTQARHAVVARILEGDGRASHAQRRAAFDNSGLAEPLRTLIEKVAKRAYTVTDEDIAAAEPLPSLHEHRLHRRPPSRRARRNDSSTTIAALPAAGDLP